MKTVDSEKLIIELNYRNNIVDERQIDNEVSSRKMFDLFPETLIDKRTLRIMQIHDLFTALDHTETFVGSARLFHSLMNPPESIELIHAKQDAFCELESNETLQEAIADYLRCFHEGEAELFTFINAHLHPVRPYQDYRKAMKTIQKMMDMIDKIPETETIYLDSLVKSILIFQGSPLSSMVKGPVCRTFFGPKSQEEIDLFMPSMKFRPTSVSFGSIWPTLPGFYVGAAWLSGFMQPEIIKTAFFSACALGVLGVAYGVLIKPVIDYESAILPMRRRLLMSNRFASAIEAVAAIDELLSLVRYSKKVPHPTCIPEITNGESHYFVAKEMRNPTLSMIDPNFVANDVDLTNQRITFVTGPNSGGKTTFCKTIVQNQLLGQIGAPVVARSAKMNIADKITYQAPSFDTLNDLEGRFGTELKETRDIFYSSTPKSLVILDEIAEGTTANEKLSFSVDIMNGFRAIGNNTILVTHSSELVEKFIELEKGQYLQVEYDGKKPTHRLIAGVSHDSHALRVAEKIGFSPKDIRNYLESKGFAVT